MKTITGYRQEGRTTALCNLVLDYISKNPVERALVVCPDDSSVHFLRRRLTEMLAQRMGLITFEEGDRKARHRISAAVRFATPRHPPNRPYPRAVFVDNWDMIPVEEQIILGVEYRESIQAVTTEQHARVSHIERTGGATVVHFEPAVIVLGGVSIENVEGVVNSD